MTQGQELLGLRGPGLQYTETCVKEAGSAYIQQIGETTFDIEGAATTSLTQTN